MSDSTDTLPPEAPTEEAKSRTSMHVKVYAPYKVYFDGEAESVSAASETGDFDILKGHHNFITLLIPCDVVIRTTKNEEKIHIQGGVMHVKADDVVIFLDV